MTFNFFWSKEMLDYHYNYSKSLSRNQFQKFKCNCAANQLKSLKLSLQKDLFLFNFKNLLPELTVFQKQNVFPQFFISIRCLNYAERCSKPLTSRAPRKGFLGILHSASNWNLEFDLDGMLVVPVFQAVATLWPDLLLFSRSTKNVIIIELTCPCEENDMCHEECGMKQILSPMLFN